MGLRVAQVDERGFVVPDGAAWGLDWAIFVEGRWLHPSRDGTVRQRLVGSTPVVETVVRTPVGEIVHRAAVATGPGARPQIVVEVRNDTPSAIAVGLSLHAPDSDLGPSAARRADAADDLVIQVPGSVSVRLPRPAEILERSVPLYVRPLPHTRTLRAVISTDADPPAAGSDLGELDAVARGWSTQLAAVRIELPDPRLTELISVGRAYVQIAAGTDAPDVGDVCPSLVVHRTATALWRWGHHHDARRLATRLVEHTSNQGLVEDGAGSPLAATGAALDLLAMVGDSDDDAVSAVGELTAGLHRRLRRDEPDNAPLWLDDHDRQLWSEAWIAAGFRGAARLVLAAGQPRAADALQAAAAATARRSERPRGLADLAAVAVAGIDGAEAVRSGPLVTPTEQAGVVRPGGDGGPPRCSPWLTLLAARSELPVARWPGAALRWLAATVSATGTWPTGIDADHRNLVYGDGHDRAAAAELCHLGLDLVVLERCDPDALELLPAIPETWVGRPVEVHGVPTRRGALSYAVRWHGDRPALLWELEGDDDRPLILRAPGLDPSWRGHGRRGEDLLKGARTRSAT